VIFFNGYLFRFESITMVTDIRGVEKNDGNIWKKATNCKII